VGNGESALEDILRPDPLFWRGKRVFLTGHTGFKGAWLACWLDFLQAEVCGFALAPEAAPNLWELAGLDQRIQSRLGDIRDAAALAEAMVDFKPEIVLHLAAQSLVHRSYAEPSLTFETNVIGTVNVLEAVRRSPTVRSVVIVTSDKCYENREWLWPYREDEALGGYDPYSASKACAELVVSSWRRSFFAESRDGGEVALASARAGNVVGGGDWARDRLIPDCVRALGRGAAVAIRNPHATRPWQHVLEPLCGYLILAERLVKECGVVAEAWNFGPPIEEVWPVSRVVDRIVTLWGGDAAWMLESANHPHEAGFLAVDATKARTRLGWRPSLGISETLQWTTDWYKRHLAGASAASLVDEQIDKYHALASH